MTLPLILLTITVLIPQTSAPRLSLDQLTAADDAAAERLMAADPAAARAVLDGLISQFDGSIHSDRDSPEQRRVQYDAGALTTGLRLADVYAKATGTREYWRRFEARRLRIDGTRLLNERQHRQALEQLSLALAEAQALHDGWLETITRVNMAYGLLEEGRPDEALAECERASAVAATLDDRAQGLTSFNLAAVHMHLKNYEKVVELSPAAIAIARRVGIRIWEGNGEMNLAAALWTLGRIDEARAAYERSLAVLMQTRDKLGQGRALFNLGLVASAQGRYGQAAEYLERALPIIKDVDIRHSHEIELEPEDYRNPVELVAHEVLADVYEKAGDVTKAAEHARAAHELRDQGVATPHEHGAKP